MITFDDAVLEVINSDFTPVVNEDGVQRTLNGVEREEYIRDWVDAHYDFNFMLLRTTRNNLLLESDWTENTNANVDTVAWSEYRQSLRDLPQNTNSFKDLKDPVWPTRPE